MRPSPDPSSVNLSIKKIGYDGNRIDWPYQIEKYEDFANRHLRVMGFLAGNNAVNVNTTLLLLSCFVNVVD